MNIIFDWLPQIKPSLRASAEMKIGDDIQESDDLKPCHSGPISVSILSSDPLAARGRSPIFTKRAESVRSGDLGPQIVSDRVLGADERSLGRAVAPTE